MNAVVGTGRFSTIGRAGIASPGVKRLPREFQDRCRRRYDQYQQYGTASSRLDQRHRPLHHSTSSSPRPRGNGWMPSNVGIGKHPSWKPLQRSSSDVRPYSSSRDPPLSTAVKQLMRHVPHPVAIITASDTSTSHSVGPSAWRGATVSSFNTVCLDPHPIVSFNIKKLSSTFDAICSSGLFNVHLLGESAEATDIATKFTLGNATLPFHGEDGELEVFAQVDAARSAPEGRLPPILQTRNAEGLLVVPHRLLCRYLNEKTVEIGDHVVVFGVVEDVFHDGGAFHDHAASVPKPCLVYVNGRYSRVEGHRTTGPLVQRRK